MIMNNKYIIVTTLCDKMDIAIKIRDVLLNKKLVAGVQIEKIDSLYWWNKELEKNKEYRMQFRTKESLYKEIEQEILKIHDYETCEISYQIIDGANEKFLKWIDENIWQKRED